MRITKIKIGSFGALVDREFEFAPGANLIEGANESGKTSLAAFVKFALYGLDGKKGSPTEKDRYINRSTGRAEGAMEFTHEGRSYRVERSVGDGTRETKRLIDLETLTAVKFACEIGEYLFGVPESVVYAVMRTESGFNEAAVSRAGACGLMQLMPETYREAARAAGLDGESAGIFDPEVNIVCGTCWLARLYRKYRNWETVYAAYNAGEAAVDRWLTDPSLREDGTLTAIPYPETAAYVKRVVRAETIYRRQIQR